MDGWHHQLNGHGFGQTLGVGDGQGGLACCGPWGCKESDVTEQLNWTAGHWQSQNLKAVLSYWELIVWCAVGIRWKTGTCPCEASGKVLGIGASHKPGQPVEPTVVPTGHRQPGKVMRMCPSSLSLHSFIRSIFLFPSLYAIGFVCLWIFSGFFVFFLSFLKWFYMQSTLNFDL